MPVLRHLKSSPAPCNCAMCHLHKTNYETRRWMRANPKKVTYLADGISTNRYEKTSPYNNQRKSKKTKKNKK